MLLKVADVFLLLSCRQRSKTRTLLISLLSTINITSFTSHRSDRFERSDRKKAHLQDIAKGLALGKGFTGLAAASGPTGWRRCKSL